MEATQKLRQAIQNYKNGDAAAFTTLYEESHKYIYVCVYNVMHGNDNAQDMINDIMQDTYVEISRHLHQLEDEEKFMSWAGTIATRKCHAYFKKNKKYVLLGEEDTTFEQLSDSEDIIPETVMQDREKQRLLKEIIDTQLTEMQKLCIIAYYYNEQKQSEIALELGIPENTVKTNLSRAKAKIKEGVLELEKNKNTRLYSVAPFFLLLLKEDIRNAIIPKELTTGVLSAVEAGSSAAGTAAGATAVSGEAAIMGEVAVASEAVASSAAEVATSGKVAVSGAKLLMKKLAAASLKTKIVAGLVGVGILGAVGMAIVYSTQQEAQPVVSEQPSEEAEVTEHPLEKTDTTENSSDASVITEQPSEGPVVTEQPSVTPALTLLASTDQFRIYENKIVFDVEGELTQEVVSLAEDMLSDLGMSSYVAEFSERVTSIGYEAFLYAKVASLLVIPGHIVSVDTGAFSGCDNLTELVIEDGVKYLGQMAFERCDNLQTVTIAGSVQTIETRMFYDCKALSTVVLKEGIMNISSGAFERCGVTVLELPESLTDIGNVAFAYCNALEYVHIPKNVTFIGGGAFWCCDGLTEIVVEGTNLVIEEDAFYKCSKLEKVILMEGVYKIGDSAFSYCTSLKEISIPDSLIQVGKDVFLNIGISSEIVTEDDWEILDGILLGNKYYQSGEVIIPEGISAIAAEAFYYENARESQNQITKVILPEGVRGIGERAFYNSNKLEEVVLPESLIFIGEGAFASCDTLKIVNLPEGITEIPKETFAHCVRLTEISVPEGVISIGEGVFQGCYLLKEVNIPESVVWIDESAFIDVSVDRLVIKGKAGSYAEMYAAECGLTFEAE